MPRSRNPKNVKGTKGSNSGGREEPTSDSETPSGPESRSSTSDEFQIPRPSKLEGTKRFQDTSESDLEFHSGSESLFTTSDKPLQIPLATGTSRSLRKTSTSRSSIPSSFTGTRKKVGSLRNPRVEGESMKFTPSNSETRRRGATPVSDDHSNSRTRTYLVEKPRETEGKSSATKNTKRKSKKYPDKNIPIAGASGISDITESLLLSNINLHSSTSSLNSSTGSHHDDSNVSEYSARESSDS